MKYLSIALLVSLLPALCLAEDRVALRIRFGMNATEAADWSGKIDTSKGKVESIRGWRWMQGDTAERNTFTVNTRRGQPQSSADRKRVQSGQQMPLADNGIIVTLSGVDEETEITFDTKPAKATLKLSDIPYGTPKMEADGN